ncbi:MAG: endonuclease V [Candidatus Aenigmatarchaeota archaeon]
MEENIKKSKFFEIQEKIYRRVRFKGIKNIEKVLCVDSAYKKDYAICVGVLFDIKNDEVLNVYFRKERVKFPYIPGLLFLREGKIILRVLKDIKENYDLIIVDGHGLSHPRKAGLATYVGVMSKKPTIGIAKKYLFGDIVDNIIYVDNMKVGIKVGKYYFSIGSNIDFESLVEFLKSINFSYPRGMVIADKLSKYLAKRIL